MILFCMTMYENRISNVVKQMIQKQDKNITSYFQLALKYFHICYH